MVRVVCLSDTHNQLDKIRIPSGDIIIHAGDICGRGTIQELETFAAQFSALPHPTKVFIAGNHDWPFQENRPQAEHVISQFDGITYLQDSETKACGLRIYGAPWQPEFYSWAFNLPRGKPLQDKWREIPLGIDILVTHGPPFGYGDFVQRPRYESWRPKGADERSVGCVDLAEAILFKKPRLHVSGHLHSGYGRINTTNTIYVNASNCNEAYQPINPPIVVDLE